MSIRKKIDYELSYLLKGINFKDFAIILLGILGSIVIGFSDALSFFTGEDSPIPEEWTWLKEKKNAQILSISAIVLMTVTSVVYITKRDGEPEIISSLQETIENDLTRFLSKVRSEIGLSNSTRLYIVMPMREKFLCWKLRIVNRTNEVEDRELDASLSLNEGIYGWAIFTHTVDREHTSSRVRWNINSLPPGYKHLNSKNKELLKSDRAGFFLLPIFEGTRICGEVIIDTSSTDDVDLFDKEILIKETVDWLKPNLSKILIHWRLVRNGR